MGVKLRQLMLGLNIGIPYGPGAAIAPGQLWRACTRTHSHAQFGSPGDRELWAPGLGQCRVRLRRAASSGPRTSCRRGATWRCRHAGGHRLGQFELLWDGDRGRAQRWLEGNVWVQSPPAALLILAHLRCDLLPLARHLAPRQLIRARRPLRGRSAGEPREAGFQAHCGGDRHGGERIANVVWRRHPWPRPRRRGPWR